MQALFRKAFGIYFLKKEAKEEGGRNWAEEQM